jgi:hypothetical protein
VNCRVKIENLYTVIFFIQKNLNFGDPLPAEKAGQRRVFPPASFRTSLQAVRSGDPPFTRYPTELGNSKINT